MDIFIGLEKAYDRVFREDLRRCLNIRGFLRHIPKLLDKYDRAKTSTRTLGQDMEHFSVVVDLHQVSALNPFLFVVVMDELT